MNYLYFDNAASTFPKAPGLGREVCDFIENNGININRGAARDNAAEQTVHEARERICQLFHTDTPERVVFTSGVTASMNMLFYGLLNRGDNVIISHMEHHAVTRPLTLLERRGITYTVIKAAEDGSVNASDFEKAIRPETRLIAVTHASNVCGTVLPVSEISDIAKRYNIFMAVDTAQTAGILDIEADSFDFLAFAGHKGLMGPQGIGGFVISERLAVVLKPHFAGGTGSYSHLYDMPSELPDRFEAGTLNLPGIAGLKHSVEYIIKEGIENIRRREAELTQYLLNRLKELPVRIIGKQGIEGRLGVVSFVSLYSDNGVLAERLADEGISLRYGLHCSPLAHEALGTSETGTIRLSVGYHTTEDEINELTKILDRLL